MTFIFTVLTFLGLLFGSSHHAVSMHSQDADTQAKADMSELSTELEMHYQRNGEYPTQQELLEEYDTALPGIDPQTLFDSDGKFIDSGTYHYVPQECTALGCKHFRLQATLSDGSLFIRDSLR